ncbi:subclass B3 metallo-beta-lactamase [Altererythrobacter sp. GH1-8]|uniref:subclass B3 metallo-beta-lactamase n=1 Tax=Altererythrobacter sp. GH1-8 TaxID=3349333 RepID=UPI00374CD4EC
MFGKTLLPAASSLLLAGCVAVAAEAGEPGKPGLPADQHAFLDTCEDWDDWDKPAPPFKLYGNTYYVGTCGIASILITDDEGHVLLDSGTQGGARVVEKNIATLGFKASDIVLLGYSHEHFDHVGGMAYIQELTGALLVSLERGAETMRSGKSDPDDPQHGMHEPFAPVSVDFILEDGDAMGVGTTNLQSFATPGHTPGGTTWLWESCYGTECKTIAFADSLSPVSADDYRFSDHPEYLAEYRAGLDRLAQLDCDILLAPHPSHARLFTHLEERTLLTMEAPCATYAAQKHADLDRRLAKEVEGE